MAAILGIDLGGTKVAFAVFNEYGDVISKCTLPLDGRAGAAVGLLIRQQIQCYLDANNTIATIGISVPGICREQQATVWAPNIPGWEDYPLLKEVQAVAGNTPVKIECDRACYILGEMWKGNAKGTENAIFLAVGTGIGAGIVIDGRVFKGAHGVSGAIGWMGLNTTFNEVYSKHGYFEYHCSGDGIARIAQKTIRETKDYHGPLVNKPIEAISSHDVFAAYELHDPVAKEVLDFCITCWGVAIANLVSLFNPEKIILGGGVFGPAVKFIPDIKKVAHKWAQPISFQQVRIEAAALGAEAGIYGAGLLALQNLKTN